MNKKIISQAFLMIFLILSMPFTIPVALADEEEDLNTPGQQCVAKAEKGESFLDFMDNGVIKGFEMSASILFAIATLVNTIDYFMNLISGVIGMIGPDGSGCCTAGISSYGSACVAQWSVLETWQSIKSSSLMKAVISIATCECCSGGKTPSGETNWASYAGGAGGICPLGDVANSLGNVFSKPGGPSGQGGISQFHLSAFDNIYTATGCLCPVAILFNLRKLKTIYQVHNCCVEQSCKNGMSTEPCERQFDEASCMYWEGSLYKTLIKVLASVAAGYISGIFLDIVKDQALTNCIFMVIELVQIPARIQAVLGAFDWMTTTFDEPQCEDLGFEDIEKQLESGYFSQSHGVNIVMTDSDGDNRMDTASRSAGASASPASTTTTPSPGIGLAIAGIAKTGMAAQYPEPEGQEKLMAIRAAKAVAANNYANTEGVNSVPPGHTYSEPTWNSQDGHYEISLNVESQEYSGIGRVRSDTYSDQVPDLQANTVEDPGNQQAAPPTSSVTMPQTPKLTLVNDGTGQDGEGLKYYEFKVDGQTYVAQLSDFGTGVSDPTFFKGSYKDNADNDFSDNQKVWDNGETYDTYKQLYDSLNWEDTNSRQSVWKDGDVVSKQEIAIEYADSRITHSWTESGHTNMEYGDGTVSKFTPAEEDPNKGKLTFTYPDGSTKEEKVDNWQQRRDGLLIAGRPTPDTATDNQLTQDQAFSLDDYTTDYSNWLQEEGMLPTYEEWLAQEDRTDSVFSESDYRDYVDDELQRNIQDYQSSTGEQAVQPTQDQAFSLDDYTTDYSNWLQEEGMLPTYEEWLAQEDRTDSVFSEADYEDYVEEELQKRVEEYESRTGEQAEEISQEGQPEFNLQNLVQKQKALTNAQQSLDSATQKYNDALSGSFTDNQNYQIQESDNGIVMSVGTDKPGIGGFLGSETTDHYVKKGEDWLPCDAEGNVLGSGSPSSGLKQDLDSKLNEYETAKENKETAEQQVDQLEEEVLRLEEQAGEEYENIESRLNKVDSYIEALKTADLNDKSCEISIEGDEAMVTIDGEEYTKNDDGEWVNSRRQTLSEDESQQLDERIEELKKQKQNKKQLEEAREQSKETRESLTPEELKQHQMAYQLTWELLNFALEEFAFPMVDDMCKEDWEASEPPVDEPEDTGTGGPGAGYGDDDDDLPTDEPCQGDSSTSSARYADGEYEISYSITPCSDMVRYKVYMKSPEYVIEQGYVGKGDTYTESFSINYLPEGYSHICVELDTAGTTCNPVVD